MKKRTGACQSLLQSPLNIFLSLTVESRNNGQGGVFQSSVPTVQDTVQSCCNSQLTGEWVDTESVAWSVTVSSGYLLYCVEVESDSSQMGPRIWNFETTGLEYFVVIWVLQKRQPQKPKQTQPKSLPLPLPDSAEHCNDMFMKGTRWWEWMGVSMQCIRWRYVNCG